MVEGDKTAAALPDGVRKARQLMQIPTGSAGDRPLIEINPQLKRCFYALFYRIFGVDTMLFSLVTQEDSGGNLYIEYLDSLSLLPDGRVRTHIFKLVILCLVAYRRAINTWQNKRGAEISLWSLAADRDSTYLFNERPTWMKLLTASELHRYYDGIFAILSNSSVTHEQYRSTVPTVAKIREGWTVRLTSCHVPVDGHDDARMNAAKRMAKFAFEHLEDSVGNAKSLTLACRAMFGALETAIPGDGADFASEKRGISEIKSKLEKGDIVSVADVFEGLRESLGIPHGLNDDVGTSGRTNASGASAPDTSGIPAQLLEESDEIATRLKWRKILERFEKTMHDKGRSLFGVDPPLELLLLDEGLFRRNFSQEEYACKLFVQYHIHDRPDLFRAKFRDMPDTAAQPSPADAIPLTRGLSARGDRLSVPEVVDHNFEELECVEQRTPGVAGVAEEKSMYEETFEHLSTNDDVADPIHSSGGVASEEPKDLSVRGINTGESRTRDPSAPKRTSLSESNFAQAVAVMNLAAAEEETCSTNDVSWPAFDDLESYIDIFKTHGLEHTSRFNAVYSSAMILRLGPHHGLIEYKCEECKKKITGDIRLCCHYHGMSICVECAFEREESDILKCPSKEKCTGGLLPCGIPRIAGDIAAVELTCSESTAQEPLRRSTRGRITNTL